MSNGDRDTVIGRWLEDGPSRVADASRRRMLSEILATPQKRRRLGLTRPWASRAGVAASIAFALTATIALGIYWRAAQPGVIVAPTASATASPQPPSATGVVKLTSFRPPFEYDAILLGGRFNTPTATLAVYRTVSGGMTIWSSPRGVVNPCFGSGSVDISGMNAIADHLRASDAIDVRSDRLITLDGHRAHELRIAMRDEPPCSTVNLLVDAESAQTMTVDATIGVLVTIADVGGETIVLERWSSNLDAWIDRTRASVDSIHLLVETDAGSP